MKSLEDYIVKILKKEWYINVWDVFWENKKEKKIIWLSDPSFCDSSWLMFHDTTLSECKDFVKKHNIKYIIDEDNNNWYIQKLRDLWDLQTTYTIKLSEKTEYNNHGTDDSMSAVRSILSSIKRWKYTVDDVLEKIWW